MTSSYSGVPYDEGQEITYLSFYRASYKLREIRGRYVSYLLPESWTNALTRDERRALIDLTDMLYIHFAELTGGEPSGTGNLRIAAVPSTCGWGCAFVGFKGIEILDADWCFQDFKRMIPMHIVPGVIVHEMAHNFDKFGHLYYLPAHAHAWTAFIQPYMNVYGQQGWPDLAPARGLFFEKEYARNYFDNALTNWSSCIRSTACPVAGIDRERVWGEMTLRFASLHDSGSMRTAVHYWRSHSANTPVPGSPEAKEELHIMGLSAGAREDVSCYLDRWRWYSSPSLRQTMGTLYPGPARACVDQDRDGVTALDGDLDDSDPRIHPGATELMNGRDDDCNGIVDDLVVYESNVSDFPDRPSRSSAYSVSLPVRVLGKLTDVDTDDYLRFYLPSAGKVTFRFRSPGEFAGWLFLYKPDWSWYTYTLVAAGERRELTFEYPAPGWYTVSVSMNVLSAPGNYELALSAPEQWPLRWGQLQPVVRSGRTYRLTVHPDPSASFAAAPTQIRFWVSGNGFVGSAPFAPSATVDWTPQANVLPGAYSYRVQPYAGDVPAGNQIGPVYFDVAEASCASRTTALTVTRSGFRLNSGTGRFVQSMLVRNATASPVAGPISVVLENLSANATLFKPAGVTECGLIRAPYVNVDLGAAGVLNANAAVTIILEFTNPTNQGITYAPHVLAGPGIR